MSILIPSFDELQSRRSSPDVWLREIFDANPERTFVSHSILSLLKPWTASTSHIGITYLTKRLIRSGSFIPSEAAAHRMAEECCLLYDLTDEKAQKYTVDKLVKLLVGTKEEIENVPRYLILPVDIMLLSYFIETLSGRTNEDDLVSDTIRCVQWPQWEKYSVKLVPSQTQLKVGFGEILAAWSQQRYLTATVIANKVFTDYQSDSFVQSLIEVSQKTFRNFYYRDLEAAFMIVEDFSKTILGAPHTDDKKEICSRVIAWTVLGDELHQIFHNNQEKALFYGVGILAFMFEANGYTTEQMVETVLTQM